MTLGLAPKQGDLLRSTVGYCEGRVAADSIYGVLHRECFTLFPDEVFADLFTDVGRRSVPPMIVAVVMVLQRRTTSPSPRSDQGRRRFLITCSRNESGPPRHTQSGWRRSRKLGSSSWMTPMPGTDHTTTPGASTGAVAGPKPTPDSSTGQPISGQRQQPWTMMAPTAARKEPVRHQPPRER
jgi:hypothetical protein